MSENLIETRGIIEREKQSYMPLFLLREHSITSFCVAPSDVLRPLLWCTFPSTQVRPWHCRSGETIDFSYNFSLNQEQCVQQENAELCRMSSDRLPHTGHFTGIQPSLGQRNVCKFILTVVIIQSVKVEMEYCGILGNASYHN